MKKKAAVPSLSDSKDNLKKNTGLLPDKPKPVKTGQKPVNVVVNGGPVEQEPDPGVSALMDQIKATGVLKNVFCNGFDFFLVRSKRTRLTTDEKSMLEDPLNRIEVKVLEMLPEYIRRQAEKGGPLIDLTAAVVMIVWAKNQELKALTGKEPVKTGQKPVNAPDKVEPVNPVNAPDKAEPVNPVNPTEEIKA